MEIERETDRETTSCLPGFLIMFSCRLADEYVVFLFSVFFLILIRCVLFRYNCVYTNKKKLLTVMASLITDSQMWQYQTH